ncbi:MAG: efflux RND transporter permease subunit, partial [Leptospiraceae bacterium]|nr:efflux RND transporter permease subunit [Leptospiraceae bacterium]
MKSNKSSFWNNESQTNSMLDRVIKFALRRRVGVLLFAAALLMAGTWRTLNTPIDVFPDLDRPTVTVLVEAHNMAPVEVESLITIPIEGALLGSPGIENVRSSSNRGFAKIQAEFDWDMDIYKCRQIVNERLNSLSGRLPGEIQPELAPISSIMGEIMLIGLTPIYDESETNVEQKEAALMELQSFARWEIERRILSIPGVSRVTVIGGMPKQYQMMLKPDAFSGHDLSIQSIYQSLDDIGHNTGGGFSIQNNQEIMIRNIGAVYDPSELDQATVGYRAGVPLKFREIGAARIGTGIRRGDA